MSLSIVLKRKLFHHSFCSKCQPHCVISLRDGHKDSEWCFINRKLAFFPHHTGIRLLSVSRNTCSLISRLTSYFIQEKAEPNKPSKNPPDNHPDASKDSGSSTSVEENPQKLLSEQKWISFLDKFKVSSLYNISSPVSVELKEDLSAESDLRKRSFQKQIKESTEIFLEKYNEDLDLILKKANAPCATKRTQRNMHKHKSNSSENTPDIIKEVKYPKIKIKNTIPVKTDNYEKTKQYLQSLGIPCEELADYPNIQEMDKDTILKCINRLKEMGIYVVFSLFLIHRISVELKLNTKAAALMRKTTNLPLMSFRQVKVYVELCQLLEKPDLDIRKLLERLANMGHYCDMLHLHRKVKKLREVGATAEEIWSNLQILHGYAFFDDKVELYRKSQFVGHRPFPVHLFLARTMSSFKEQLALGSEVDVVAQLLGVSVADVQGCWGSRKYNTSRLQYKVHMCLAAGISKNDIFNNLGELMGLPVEQCHAVTTCFRNSGLPASVFVLRDMVNAAKMHGYGGDHGHKNTSLCNGDTGQTCADSGQAQSEEDWVGERNMLCPEEIQVPTMENNSLGMNNNITSTNKQRRRILELIDHLIQPDATMTTIMHESSVNVSAVEMLDVQKNLEYLISKDYTRDHIAKCPLILAHRHKDLARIVSEVNSLILSQLQSASMPPSLDSFSSLLTASPAFTSTVCGHAEELTGIHGEEIKTENPYVFRYNLLASPEQRLNVFQYFLEKENSFSLASVD